MAELASLRVNVHGEVQGVFFRAFAREHAQRLGLTGYAKNLPAGAVEVRAEGERERLEALLEHLRRGPPFSRVEKVEVEWGEWTGAFEQFRISY